MTSLSIVLPVHDEEELLEATVRGLVDATRDLDGAEILICENGSRDRTPAIARELAESGPVRVVALDRANYGAAIRAGIESACGRHVAVVNADLWDAAFLRQAPTLLERCEVVVASKRHPESLDERTWARRALTRTFTGFLNVAFGYEGTDTHGMKALRRDVALRALAECVSSDELLDSELVVRIQRAGGRILEVPLRVREQRPSRRSIRARIAPTVRDIVRLAWALRRSR